MNGFSYPTTTAILTTLLLVAVTAGCSDSDEEPPQQRSNTVVTSPDAETASAPEPAASSPATPASSRPTSTDPTTSTAPAPPVTANAVVRPIPKLQWRRIVEAGMVRPECPIQRRGQLRRVDVNHYDFRGRVRRGQLVVNADVAPSTSRVFTALFAAEFPIRRMQSVEAYAGDNTASLRADNTAAFNCRRPTQINAPFLDSPHANGRAIDVNPQENPWMDLRCDCWSPGSRFAERRPGPGRILRNGVGWREFRAEGWIWQNIDVPDYMHFDTGYPSAPFERNSGRRTSASGSTR
ncbi:MAG: M15 family metallopeptidase [Nocardioidaceae bacterium]|nr:M15 family metallopeptidase [Nocardioidaceae bacterium]